MVSCGVAVTAIIFIASIYVMVFFYLSVLLFLGTSAAVSELLSSIVSLVVLLHDSLLRSAANVTDKLVRISF